MKKWIDRMRSRLQIRLLLLISLVALPLLLGGIGNLTLRAGDQMEKDANAQLRASNRTLSVNTATWLDLNVRALQTLAGQPGMASMELEQQKPLLENMQREYSYMYLVSTTDLDGMNVARNDANALTDYSDRPWFQTIRDGQPLAFQSLIGRTSGQPALVVSTAIRDEAGQTVGVAMFAADLGDLSREVRASTIGDTGYAFVVDANNQVIGHPTLEYTAESQLLDYSSDPAVVALKNSPDRITSYKDSSGNRWRVYTHRLENGWGIIVQQRESEVLAPLRDFQRAALIVILIVAVAVLVSMWVVIGQALRPVRVLTQTASAIAGGDLTRRTAIQRRDEVGVLALSFDTMTSQLQDSINTLEERVKTRTHDLDLARQEAERANNIKSQFLASVSHELRTPLNAIINFTQFVLSGMMGPVTDRQNNALNKSLNSAVHLLDLINDVLDISKIEAGSLQLFVETDVDVAAEAKEVVETAGALLKDKPVELTLEVTPALPLIWGDKQRIRQIMLNLVSNACKFTEQGQIKLCVLRRDESVLVTVTDTGPGIPEEERKIIFEVFQQTQVGLQKGGGTGLGLPISKRLAEAHGGTLWFESTVGKGSTFYVKLPVAAEVLKPLMVSPEKTGEGHG